MKILETETHWIVKCRACGRHHIPKTQGPNQTWAMSGTADSPTFHPSINECCNPPSHKDYRPDVETSRCHFIVAAGHITYCGDCTHSFADQTLPLEDFTEIEIKLHEFR